MIGFGRPRQPIGVREGGEFAARARRDDTVTLGLHEGGLVTIVNESERGVAVPYSPDQVTELQARSVDALEWMDAPAGMYVDTYDLGGVAWVYFVETDGAYTKVVLTPDGDYIGSTYCYADRYNSVADDYSGEFNLDEGDGYWPDLEEQIAASLTRS